MNIQDIFSGKVNVDTVQSIDSDYHPYGGADEPLQGGR